MCLCNSLVVMLVCVSHCIVTLCTHIHTTQSLPFQSIVHQLTTFDVQLTVDNGLIVFAVGQLRVSLPHHFSSEWCTNILCSEDHTCMFVHILLHIFACVQTSRLC